jgi:hypothetical protein
VLSAQLLLQPFDVLLISLVTLLAILLLGRAQQRVCIRNLGELAPMDQLFWLQSALQPVGAQCRHVQAVGYRTSVNGSADTQHSGSF